MDSLRLSGSASAWASLFESRKRALVTVQEEPSTSAHAESLALSNAEEGLTTPEVNIEDGTPSSANDEGKPQHRLAHLRHSTAQASAISQYIAAASTLRPPRLIRRGIRVSEALFRWRSVFRNNPDSLPEERRAELYSRSEVVEEFDAFVSHSWAGPGTAKWLALALEEAGVVPMMATIAVCLASMAIQRIWGLPGDAWRTFRPEDAGLLAIETEDEPLLIDMLPSIEPAADDTLMVLSPWIFGSGLIAALVAGSLRLALSNRTYFVDCCCIHQTDPAKKLRGIRHLGGFLSLSSQLTVLWDDTYFTRLWCVYELATFRALHPRRPVGFLPLRFCVTFVVGFIVMVVYFVCLAVWLAELLRIPDPNDHVDDSSLFWLSVCLHWGATFLACTTGVLIGADMELQRSTLRQQLRSFDASKADCSSETDRAEILAAIDGIYEGVGGIDAFNRMVATQMKEQFLPIISTRQLVRKRLSVWWIGGCCLLALFCNSTAAAPPLAQGVTAISCIGWLIAGIPLFASLTIERGAQVVQSLAESNLTRLPQLLSNGPAARGLLLAGWRTATEDMLLQFATFGIFFVAVCLDHERFGLDAAGCVVLALCLHLGIALGAYRMLSEPRTKAARFSSKRLNNYDFARPAHVPPVDEEAREGEGARPFSRVSV